jgi:hypothetical protein
MNTFEELLVSSHILQSSPKTAPELGNKSLSEASMYLMMTADQG